MPTRPSRQQVPLLLTPRKPSLGGSLLCSLFSDPREYLPLYTQVTFGLESDGPEGIAIRYHTLGLFGSLAQRRTSNHRTWPEVVMNTGGPVWAVDWCPTRCHANPHQQFVAVSSHASPSETHIFGKRSSLLRLSDTTVVVVVVLTF